MALSRLCGEPCYNRPNEEGEKRVKDLVTEIAKALVDIPDEVTVREVEGEQVTVLELRVAPSDLGKVDREAGAARHGRSGRCWARLE